MASSEERAPAKRCPGVTRRSFLVDTGMGFTGLALGAMLFKDGVARADPAVGAFGMAGRGRGRPHFEPKAKSVIWIFLVGGFSHVETFDVKPALTRYGGKSIDETPFKDALDPARIGKIIEPNPDHATRKLLLSLQTGYRPYGKSGLVVGDWFRHVGECADDLAIVRSLYTIHNDHGAQLTFHTGRHPREGALPTVGSWA